MEASVVKLWCHQFAMTAMCHFLFVSLRLGLLILGMISSLGLTMFPFYRAKFQRPAILTDGLEQIFLPPDPVHHFIGHSGLYAADPDAHRMGLQSCQGQDPRPKGPRA